VSATSGAVRLSPNASHKRYHYRPFNNVLQPCRRSSSGARTVPWPRGAPVLRWVFPVHRWRSGFVRGTVVGVL